MQDIRSIPGGRWLATMVAILSAVWISAVPAAAQGIAIVTDVSGEVTGPGPITILSEIAADARLQLEPGAKLVALYIKSGDEYAFSGPAQVQFQPGGPNVISGATAQ